MRPIFDADPARHVLTDFGTIPWDAANERARDADGEAGRLLLAALAANAMTVPDPYVPPAAPPRSFQARDLIDLLTVDDLSAIETAVQSSPALRLLWLRLRTREGKPVIAEGEAFAQGWTGLTAALGQKRADAIATELGFGD